MNNRIDLHVSDGKIECSCCDGRIIKGVRYILFESESDMIRLCPACIGRMESTVLYGVSNIEVSEIVSTGKGKKK